jgi:hypothetical protein
MSDKLVPQQDGRIYLPVYEGTEFKPSNTNTRLSYEQLYVNGWPEANIAQQYTLPDYNFVIRSGSANQTTLSPTIASYGTSDSMVCIANTVVTQLYDVYVAAFYDAAANDIYIIQYRPIAQTSTKIGTITSCTNSDLVFITEITNGAALTPGIAVSYQKGDRSFGTGLYALSTAGVFTTASLTTIGSASFPSNLATPRIITGPFQFMNGHSYIMTIDGFIYESQFTSQNADITNWNTLATVTASQYPDRGLGLYRYKDVLIALGQDSLEFWAGVNNNPPQSSLVRTDQAFIKFGGISPKLCINANDVLYWVAGGSAGTMGLWKLDGYNPVKLSTSREDLQFLSVFGGSTLAYTQNLYTMEIITINNKQHIVMPAIGETASQMLCYNLLDAVWWQMTMPGAGIIATTAFGSSYPANTYNQYFFTKTNADTGNSAMISGASNCSTKVFTFIKSIPNYDYQDLAQEISSTVYSAGITWTMQLNTKWFNTEVRKRINRIILLCDGGVAGTDSITCTFIRNGVVMSGVQNVEVTRTMQGNPPRYYLTNCGTCRSLFLIFNGTTAVGSDEIRIRGVELSIAQGTH